MENRIKCNAYHCKYHNEKDECEATKISVGNPQACTSGETYCNTFVSKN